MNRSVAHKIISIVSSLSLFIQTLSPLASLAPKVYASEPTTSNVTFDSQKNSFTISVNTTDSVGYTLAYRTDAQTNAVKGTSDQKTANFTRDIYAGTCSTGGTCVPDNVIRGIYKSQVGTSFLNKKQFTIDHGNLVVVYDGSTSSANLTDADNYWLEHGTELTPTVTPTVTPTPTATVEATLTPTPTVVENGQILDGAATQKFASLKTDGHVDTTVVQSYSCRADSLNGCLTTDKNDYAPTSVAVITGYGFAPNTQYNLEVSTDGLSQTYTITTDSQGSFTYSYTLYSTYHKLYTVQLKDLSGQVAATTTFTDTSFPFNVTLCHYDNGQGGKFTPNTVSINSVSDCVTVPNGHGSHSNDIIPAYNCGSTSYPGKNLSTVFQGATGQAILSNGCSIPQPDLTATKTNDVNGNAIVNVAFNWKIHVANSGSATATFSNGQTILIDNLPSSGATYGSVTKTTSGTTGTINCSISSNNLTCSASGTVTLPAGSFFDVTIPVTPTSAGTLANPRSGDNNKCQVDPGEDNGNINESNENNNNCSDNVSVSNTGTITVNKVLTQGDSGKFNLQIDSSTAGTGGNVGNGGTTGAVSVSASGTHTVGETGSNTSLSNYSTTYSCVDGQSTVVSGSGATSSSFSVPAGHSIICTFTNTRKQGRITFQKVVNDQSDVSAWTFTIGGGNGTAKSGDTKTYNTGSYSVIESGPDGYTLAGASGICSLIDGAVTLSVTDQGGTCTITNTRNQGTIELKKAWSGTAGQTTLNIGTSNGGSQVDTQLTGANGNTPLTTGVNSVNPGTYYVSETGGLDNYSSSLTCTDNERSVTPGEGNSVIVASGHAVICTFTNTRKQGRVTFQKLVDDQTDVSGWTFTVDDHVYHSGDSATFDTGTYTVTESGSSNYTLFSVGGICTGLDGGNSATLTVNQNGGTCTFTNHVKRGTVIVTKFLDDNADGTKQASESGLPEWDIVLGETTKTTGDDGTVTFDNLLPDSYSLSEVLQDGWNLSNIYCDNEDFSIDNSNDHTVNVPAGGTINCFVGNYQKGHIIVIKDVVDPNGNPVNDTSTGFDFSMTGEDPFVLYDEDGGKSFDVNPGTYTITETPDANYTFDGCTAVYGGQSVGVSEDFGKTVKVNSGDTVTVTCVNKQKQGHVGGFKWNDLNGNGQVDCNNERETCEPKLSGWTIFIDLNGNGKLDNGEPSTKTDGSGNYSFDLNPGTYRICEVLQDGWQETFPVNAKTNNCHIVTLGSNETFDGEKNFGNEFVPPVLHISKSNNASGDKSPGDSVTYTITLKTLQNSIHNLNVIDLLPSGFKFHAGSATAVSSNITKGVGGVLTLPSQPTYASPGTWTFPAGYTLDPGEVLTLTLTADIDGSQAPGKYKDVAWAAGTTTENTSSTRVLAEAQPEGFVSTNFVGTKVNVVKEQQISKNINIVKQGQVLGASTSLPSTGGKTIWVILASIFSLFGVLLVTIGLFMRKKLSGKISKILGCLVLMLGLAYVLVNPVGANATVPALSVRLEQPKSPTFMDNFNIIFVALDTSSSPSPLTVKCLFKKNLGDSWTQFGSDIAVSAGGNTGNCAVTSSQLNESGKTYYFSVTVTNGPETETSESEGLISVDFNTSGPGTPSDYSKTRQSCSYLIHFKTSDDGGKTVKVEIYRSENTSFTLDSGSRVQTISVGSNTNKDITDTVPDCNKTYYYALRAFDSSGNASGYVGDSVITTTTTTITTTGGGAIPVSGGANLPGTQVLGEKAGTEAGVLGEATPSGKPEIVNLEKKPFSKKNIILVIVFVGLGIIILYYALKKKNQQNG